MSTDISIQNQLVMGQLSYTMLHHVSLYQIQRKSTQSFAQDDSEAFH